MEFYDDEGNLVATGAETTAAWLAQVDKVQEHNRQALAQLKPHELARLETWLRTRTHTAPPVRPQSRPSNGRAPREARNNRVRGSKRSSVRRSSERSGDSGSEDGEPSPARECAWCGEPIDHLNADARYCGAKRRVYAQRQRDRLEPDRMAERRLLLLTEAKAPPPVRCKCDPKGHLVDGGVCVPCGRARGNGAVAWLTGDIPSRQLTVHQPSRAREWRTRPSRSESARLRRTRRDYIDESIKAVAT